MPMGQPRHAHERKPLKNGRYSYAQSWAPLALLLLENGFDLEPAHTGRRVVVSGGRVGVRFHPNGGQIKKTTQPKEELPREHRVRGRACSASATAERSAPCLACGVARGSVVCAVPRSRVDAKASRSPATGATAHSGGNPPRRHSHAVQDALLLASARLPCRLLCRLLCRLRRQPRVRVLGGWWGLSPSLALRAVPTFQDSDGPQ